MTWRGRSWEDRDQAMVPRQSPTSEATQEKTVARVGPYVWLKPGSCTAWDSGMGGGLGTGCLGLLTYRE